MTFAVRPYIEDEERDKILILFEKYGSTAILQSDLQNVIVVRHKFNTRSQGSNENIEHYVTELKRLENDCSYTEN